MVGGKCTSYRLPGISYSLIFHQVWFPRSQDDGIALDERLPEPRRSGVSGGSRSREREREREREDRPDRQGDYFTIGDEA